MREKKDFHRLLSAKFTFDDDLFWCFHYWYEKEFGKKNDFFCNSVDVIGYPKDGYVTLEFDADETKRFDIPLSDMYYEDKKQPEATMLWHSNYYDGPLSGLAEYKDKLVWFNIIDWEHDNLFNMRTFGMYELSAEEIKYELAWHQLFCEQVGYHCNYENGKRVDRGEDFTQESMDKFYAEAKNRPQREYTKNKLIVEIDESYFNRGLPKKEVDND